MTAILTDPEVQSLRFHLGYGQINVGAYPYTPDGFLELFRDVISPNLQTAAETTATTAIVAGSTTTVTPVAMTGIAVNVRLVVDVGDDAEVVAVKSLPSGTTFSAKFLLAHPATGYPVAVESGLSRLRMLLHSADKAWAKIQSPSITGTAGLKSVGKGQVEWYDGGSTGQVLKQTRAHLTELRQQIADLVRVPQRDGGASGSAQTECY